MNEPALPAAQGMQAATVEAPLTLEHVDVEGLGVDPENPEATPLMSWCVGTLQRGAVRPDGVRLVITGDFVQSVRERSVTEHQQQNYHVSRNAGMVGAKTVPRPDGTIDVMIPALLFAPDPDPDIVQAREAITCRTIAHESAHVAMNQADETSPGYDNPNWVQLNMLSTADAVMEEYRAELAVPPQLRGNADSDWDPLAVVYHLRDALKRIAAVEYQSHLDVDKLNYDVGQECLHSWQLLAYVAAAHLQAGGPIASIPEEVAADPLWRWMVQPHWTRFLEVLAHAPPASTRTTRAALEPTVRGLAEELHAWLETLGFRWRQVSDGRYEFLVVHWKFMT